MEQIYKIGCTHKINNKNDQNTYFRGDLSQR